MSVATMRRRGSVWALGLPGPYFYRDEFTPNASAGGITGTFTDYGYRLALDTNSKLTQASNKLSAATGGGGNFNPSYVGAWALGRQAGQLVYIQVNYSAGRMMCGVLAASTLVAATIGTNRRPFFDFNGSSSGVGRDGSGTIAAMTTANSTDYITAIAFRDTGSFFFIKGGAFTNWTLLYIEANSTSTFNFPFISSLGTTAVYTSDYFRSPDDVWLPTPLASDGFSTTTTDGLGHSEGTIGAIGTGGNGLSWTDSVGTWGVSGGTAAASALSGGIAIRTVDTSKADVIATAKLTRSSGNVGVVVRYADSSNYVYAIHTGTNAQLIKVVAGVTTTLVNVVTTYSAGAEIRVICEGQAFRLYYNNAFIGTQQTIADAGLASGTRQGLYTTATANTFDDFTVYARGSGGEYAALDTYNG